MRHFDVFNGDADGICALHQLRLADPVDSTLVTGLKHDIGLLERVPARCGDVVTVLDVSLDRNRAALLRLLGIGARVRYFDHHHAGEIPPSANLEPVIDSAGRACTSTLVDRHLAGRFRVWAVVGAFGDNLDDFAASLATVLSLDVDAMGELRELGKALNYNAYGMSIADVALPPEAAYRLVHRYRDPFELLRREVVIGVIAAERRADLERAAVVPALRKTAGADAYVLPNATWSRRVSGELANRLALARPHKAHAVIVPLGDGGFGVSVRSPRGRGPLAVDFCRGYSTGGGRREAAGIERLDQRELEGFLAAFENRFNSAPSLIGV